jgi:lipooligosaccharide transport system ATP-binding protein
MIGQYDRDEPVVWTRSLTKSFDSTGTKAVDDLDLELPKGSITAVIGPNGAGKTTMVRMLYGRTIPTAGTVRVLGRDPVSEPRAVRAMAGIVPQHINLDAALSLGDNLEIYAGMYGLSRRDARQRAEARLGDVGLSSAINRTPDRVSGGQARRALIARALVNDPRVVLLDEPTANLDLASAEQVWNTLRHLRSAGLTLLVTTHLMDEVSHYCDHIVVMSQGRKVEQGRPDEVVRRHVGEAVLEFDATVEPSALPPGLDHVVIRGRLIAHQPGGDRASLLTAAGQARGPYTLRPGNISDVYMKLFADVRDLL